MRSGERESSDDQIGERLDAYAFFRVDDYGYTGSGSHIQRIFEQRDERWVVEVTRMSSLDDASTERLV